MSTLGFTGTRDGMTFAQMLTVAHMVERCDELHHGDCVGADFDAHRLAMHHQKRVVIHPPDNDRLRARCWANEFRDEKPYLDRNRDIVDESDVLIATPKETCEGKGGTWYTVRYARKVGKEVNVVWPNGSVTVFAGSPPFAALDGGES